MSPDHDDSKSPLETDPESAIPPEIEAAYKEAKERGLPEGWTCSIDKRKRRKWTAPNNGKSCDSIPKALAISVELGLLPVDTVLPTGGSVRKKKGGGPKSTRPRKKQKSSKDCDEETKLLSLGSSTRPASSILRRNSAGSSSRRSSIDYAEFDEDDGGGLEKDRPDEAKPPARAKRDESPSPDPMDPETTLEVAGMGIGERKAACLPTTVHWDPDSPDGNKIGWKIKIMVKDQWCEGRVLRYDPCTHKHKVKLDSAKKPFWIWLRNEQHTLQIATRVVWALVKGYAWWPALVMEANSEASNDVSKREGFVTTEFFGTGEIACIRDTEETVRPFDPNVVDPVVQKHRRKRNKKACDLACEEVRTIKLVRNKAALYYARSAFAMSSYYSPKSGSSNAFAGNTQTMVGKRVRLFRNDVNYPYGDTVVGVVRKYSYCSKKWLLSFNFPEENKTKYPSAWMNIFAKENSCTVLDVKNEDRTENLLPFLYGFSAVEGFSEDTAMANLLQDRCHGCAESLGDISLGTDVVTCNSCRCRYHLGCIDPPMSHDQYQRLLKSGHGFECSRCTVCTGCYQKDITFGSHSLPSPPPMLTVPDNSDLHLCFSCQKLYETERYCPNCAHTWDDKRFYLVEKQILAGGAAYKRKKRNERDLIEDDLSLRLTFGSFESDEAYSEEFKVEPRCYYPETEIWGFTENEMLLCDSCNVWVHAGCSGLNEKEYNATSSGTHPIFSKEFLCFACCRKRCKKLIKALQDEDHTLLFAVPVSEKDAPNYYDLIKEPMSLKQMIDKLDAQSEVFSYEWVRQDFELMVLNALTFNRYYTEIWREAKRFFQASLANVFTKYGKAAPPSKYFAQIEDRFKQAETEIKNEEDRIQVDESVEKKDLIAGSEAIVAAVHLPELCTPKDQPSCIPSTVIKMDKVDAFFCCWMDCCFTCGSSGASDCFLFCVDCGEAFHSFCVGAPIHSMESSSVSGWRCSNCKICEISGDVPEDEKRMIYCEMCDRAFTLDLLDPPLISAPDGLWICGQCVDCKTCQNTAERGGASLKFWSQDPETCFRCGGCTCLVQEYSVSKCQICNMFLRETDGDFETCSKCGSAVHFSCDKSLKNTKYDDKRSKYRCPSCSRPTSRPFADMAVQKDRDSLAKAALDLVESNNFSRSDGYSKCDHLDALLGELDWQLRKEWISEYRAIVSDAIKLYCTAKTLGDPRFVIQQVLQRMHQLPPWLGHRALRFAQLVKRQKFDQTSFFTEQADTAVVVAKLAAAFIEVASKTLGTSKEKEVQFLNRMQSLIVEPDCNGLVAYPADRLKEVGDEVSFEGDTLVLKPRAQSATSKKDDKESASMLDEGITSRDNSLFRVATPLSGWSPEVGESMGVKDWKDPRECCLCHLCGDSDAGVKAQGAQKTEVDLPTMGRLLPVGSEGHWVHASCAIWSSEVWEEGDSGRLHAVEKARGRGAQLKCFGCGFSGATVGCSKGQCPFNYHFCCAGPCGAMFSADRHVFCQSHKSVASTAAGENVEHMKALMVVPEKSEQDDPSKQELCTRLGSLIIHAMGGIETRLDGFHNEEYIFPPGFVSSRIFWSMTRPRSRTVYIMKIQKTAEGTPLFSITPCEDTSTVLSGSSPNEVYSQLMEKVKLVNAPYFSQGDLISKLPMVRNPKKKTYGLNGPQFFGLGLDQVRRLLETLPNVEAVVAPLSQSSQTYRFCFTYGKSNDANQLESLARDVQRKRIAEKTELSLQNTSGCARCEGIKAVVTSGGSGRITRALVRSVEEEDDGTQPSLTKKAEEKAKAERNLVQTKYRAMKDIPMEQRLAARRSHIHGWGLFTKCDILKDDPVVEYTGEIIHKRVADKRERAYEQSGEGSCYMFRLDLERIVDATKIGCMARFMNHSCCPNSYAKSILVETESGQDRKIVVFALRDIDAGEEITYDYKFPIEDGSIRCTCGALNCIGRLN